MSVCCGVLQGVEGLLGDCRDFVSRVGLNTSPEGFVKALSMLTVIDGDGDMTGEEVWGGSGEPDGGDAGDRDEELGCAGEGFCLQY